MRNLNLLIDELADETKAKSIADRVTPACLANDILRSRLMCLHYIREVQHELALMQIELDSAKQSVENHDSWYSNALSSIDQSIKKLQHEE